MEVYRIVREEYSRSFDVPGRPARWNHQDQFVLYTSSSRALATLELLVNLAAIHPSIDYKVMVIDIPDDIEKVEVIRLPSNWRLRENHAVRNLGSDWYRQAENMVLRVPSAVIPQEHNYLVNTRHHDFEQKVKLMDVEDYFWDSRIKSYEGG